VSGLRTLELVLTSQCNLRCGYCFENAKKDGRMSWETMKAALDGALASPEREIRILFFGGEPALEFPSIRRAVGYVEEHRRRSQRAHFKLLTNGVLLGDEELSFLAAHRIDVQLSFDGVPAAQALRGRETFAVLDRLLDTVRRDYPVMFRRRFAVSITLLGRTIPYLADSVEYFLGKDVRSIEIGPSFTHDPTFRTEMIEDLRAQFRRIDRASRAHLKRTGRVPVTALRRDGPAERRRPKSLTMCGVMRGEKLAVDVDGQSHGCVLFASSYQRFSTPFLRERLESLALGDVRTGEPLALLPIYEDRVRRTEIFHDKQEKYSSYARCGTCRFLSSCGVCPVSIGNQPGVADPRRVPDLQCAYYLVSLSTKARFPVRRPARPSSPIVTTADLARAWT
jgi:sulfatase maturation enzyme AslB (radical SAM superfamily)